MDLVGIGIFMSQGLRVEIEVDPPSFLAVAYIEAEQPVGFWKHNESRAITGMKPFDAEIAWLGRDLPLIEKQSPIERLPDAIPVLHSERQRALVSEAIV